MTDAVSRAKARLRYYQEAPDGVVQFVRERIRAEPDPWQAEALLAYQTGKPRTCLKACKNPGKTAVLSWISWHFLAVYPHPNIAAVSITGENLRDGLWKEMALWQMRDPMLMDQFTWTAERIFHKQFPGTWWMSARKFSKTADTTQQSNTLAGLHRDYMLFILDETGSMPRAVMAAADAALGSGVVTRLVQAGNPTNLEGPLYDACTRERRLWNIIDVTGDPDNPKRAPRVKLEWARAQIEKYGRENPWVKVNVLGEFPSASINSLLGVAEVEVAMKRHYQEDVYKWAQKRLGVDVARFGDDLSVWFPRQGLVAFKPVFLAAERDSPVSVLIANRTLLAKQRWNYDLLLFDDTGGWAHGAIDVLRTQGEAPIPLQYHLPAPDPRYKNLRAYGWMMMAEWVKKGGALPNVPELVDELITPTYTFENGKFVMEDKDQVKDRLGRSTNYADALANTCMIPDAPNEMEELLLKLTGHSDKRHAKTEFDPHRDERAEATERAAIEFDPFDPRRDTI